MTPINPLLLTDYYKVGHVFQYPKNTSLVYSNFTPRKSRLEGVNEMVFFGLQYFIKEYLIKQFNDNFFNLPKEVVLNQYKRRIRTSLGDLPTYEHIEKLHDLGYLPVVMKALPEGSRVPMRVPAVTIYNTKPEFYWLPNFLETLLSSVLWLPSNSATIAFEYRKLLNSWAERTGMPQDFVQWQGHDFSFRGMSSPESAIMSGMGHLLSFTGTDTIPAIDALEYYYGANAETELIGGSVAATEHSVMASGSKEYEIETFRRLINEIYPSGILSIVSDTWDLWKVLTDYMPRLKDQILSRDGKIVVRPDSGLPEDILCGNPKGKTEAERKGVIELLWDVFGGTLTDKGYKVLDSHIGAIYGDSITLVRANEICERLAAKGFASQVVFGIGSFTYQYNTRDTFGSAVKSTYIEIREEKVGGLRRVVKDSNGNVIDYQYELEIKSYNIFKDPITDDGTKKSATGLLKVFKNENGTLELIQQVNWEEEKTGELVEVFRDGKLLAETTLYEIRNKLYATL